MKKLAYLAGVSSLLISSMAISAASDPETTAVSVTGDAALFVKETFTYAPSSGVYMSYDHDASSIGVVAANAKGSGAVFGGSPSAPLTRCSSDTRVFVDADQDPATGVDGKEELQSGSSSESVSATIDSSTGAVTSFGLTISTTTGC